MNNEEIKQEETANNTEEKNVQTQEKSQEQMDHEKENAERAKRMVHNLITDPEEQIRQFGKGKFDLAVPIRAGGRDVETLYFDFTRITGREYVEALDSDLRSTNAFRVSATQAIALFALAAAKATDGIDATDIRERISARDGVKAVQLATIFFTACNREGNRRISNE